MRTVLNILLVQLFQFSQTYFLRNKSTEISFWCWFPGIHSRKLSKHWLLYISDYFAGVGVTLGKLLAWLRRSEFDWHPQLFQFLHQTVASGSSVFPWCCHLLRVIERDRVYFLLKNRIAVPSQLHLVHCNQTNHGGWWSMIAFRLACLHIVLSLSFFFFFFFLWTPAASARLWSRGDGRETEGLRSICYHCEIMTAQPLIISSGWTLITLLIHVHLIWTDDLVIFILHGKKKKKILNFRHPPAYPLSHSLCLFT